MTRNELELIMDFVIDYFFLKGERRMEFKERFVDYIREVGIKETE